jgi:hypothetical protein
MQIPERGIRADELLATPERYRAAGESWRAGAPCSRPIGGDARLERERACVAPASRA